MRPYALAVFAALVPVLTMPARIVPAWADGPPVALPDLVVTATRTPRPAEDIPAGVTVIDRATIEDRGYNTLADALAGVPGLTVSPSGGPGQLTSVFIRGTNSNHVLVLRDGMPINDGSAPQDAYNFGVDTLSDIERIEVIRGPMAAVYGSGAIGGVINLISRRGTAPGFHWSGDLSGGYPAQVRGAINASGIEGPIDFSLTGEAQTQHGYDVVPQREAAYTGAVQGYRDQILTLNLGYTPIEGTRVSLFLRGSTAYFGFAPDNPTFNNTNADAQASSLLGRIGVSSTLFNGMLDTSAYVGRLQDDRGYLTPFDPNNPNMTVQNERYHAYRTDFQWNNTLHLDNVIGVPGLSDSAFTFGYEYTADTVHTRANDSYSGFPDMTMVSASQYDNAAYVGLESTILRRLDLTGQVRQDWIQTYAPTTWRIGGVFDLHELATHIKAAYGTAFREPSLYEKYGIDTYYTGNSALVPEESSGWEFGFSSDIAAAGRSNFVSFGSTYFDERVRNLIVTVFNSTSFLSSGANVASAHMHGLENEVTVRPAPWIDIHATWTLLNTVSDGEPVGQGPKLLRRPQNQGSVDVALRPLPKLKIVVATIYTGPARDSTYDNLGNFMSYGIGQHGLVTNLSASYQATGQVKLYVTGTNIFDSKFEPVNGYQMPGATVVAGVHVTL